MRKQLERFLNNISDFIVEDLMEDAEAPLNRIIDHYYGRYYDNKMAVQKAMEIICTAIKLDRSITEKEMYFLREVFHVYAIDQHLVNVINNLAMSEYQFLDEFDCLPYRVQADVVFVMICVCGADDRIAATENQFLKQLLRKL